MYSIPVVPISKSVPERPLVQAAKGLGNAQGKTRQASFAMSPFSFSFLRFALSQSIRGFRPEAVAVIQMSGAKEIQKTAGQEQAACATGLRVKGC